MAKVTLVLVMSKLDILLIFLDTVRPTTCVFVSQFWDMRKIIGCVTVLRHRE